MTREDLDNHLRSDRFAVLIGAMSLLNADPEVRFNTVESMAGAEDIKAVRA
jgi:hypothetical protein